MQCARDARRAQSERTFHAAPVCVIPITTDFVVVTAYSDYSQSKLRCFAVPHLQTPDRGCEVECERGNEAA